VAVGLNAVAGWTLADLTANGDFIPLSDGVSDLGATGARWRNLYLAGAIAATSLSLAGSLSVGGTSAFTGVAEFADDIVLAATKKLRLDGSASGNTYIHEAVADRVYIVAGGVTVGNFASPAIDSIGLTLAGGFALPATSKLYFDGGNDTYIFEQAANRIEVIAGGVLSAVILNGTFSVNGDLFIPATERLYLDGGGDTYFTESSANTAHLVAGGNAVWWATATAFQFSSNVDVQVQPAKKLYLDGGGDTYIAETSANIVNLYAGGTAAVGYSATALSIPSGNKFYVDGGGDTYVYESAANQVSIVAGGTTQITFGGGNAVLQATGKLYLDGGGDTYIYEAAGNLVYHYAGGNARWIVASSGVGTYSTIPLWLDGGGDTYWVESSANIAKLYVGGVAKMSVSFGSLFEIDGPLGVTSQTTLGAATAGTSGAPPAQVAGYWQVIINGSTRLIPYYN
jgi:hypothetical protein